MTPLDPYVQTAIAAANRASKIALERFGHAKSIGKDGGFAGSALTQADLDSEQALIDTITKRHPSHAVFGEETGMHGQNEWVWYLDPIDGTVNYERGNEQWGINIGLAHNDEPVVGVIAYPARGYTLHAAKGMGAWRGDERIHTSERALHEALYYGGGTHDGRIVTVRELAAAVGDLRMIGAGSVAFGEVATGRAEVLIGGPSNHDICAGTVLVREAGGRVTQQDGEPWRIDSETLVATNGHVHTRVLEIVAEKHLR